ncbi:PAS domain S-box protein [Paenibacillus chibensis]|uniref:PAS domain S-box protein n=1 Tax=Paenibacillus chibensis TaxID=59846 RepID=UPI0013E2BDD1|nr:PAS domain S-box protein [Paenibacillus chibensis]MEC0368936.1 PAS domain S-box protein [Paenibacillus chibensis]
MGKPTFGLVEYSQEELMEMLLEQQGMTFKFKKIEGRFIHTFCTGQLLGKIGLTPQQVVGRELKEFLREDFAAAKEEYYSQAWEGKEDVSYEGELLGVSYLASLRPVKRHGKVVEVIASCVDITERKVSEKELTETKELLESLFESSVDGICIMDTSGGVIRINEAFENIYGWKNAELIGRPAPMFPAHLENRIDEIYNHLNANKKVIHLETIRPRKDGENIHVFLTLAPIQDAEENIIALTVITRDISERKKLEDFYRKADKLNAVGQLAAGLAHEIRNPLTSLRGFLQIMQSGRAEKGEYYDIMLSKIDRINSIVNEFLVIAKPYQSNAQKNDLVRILQSVVTLLEAQAALNNINIATEADDDFPQVVCSEMEIKQVFVNILKNAIEAMPRGGDIRIQASVLQGSVRIRFIDQGEGISEKQFPRLGEPFYTTKEKGTGLGLMMCYKIIGDHKGEISIDSALSKGTTFDIMLPLTSDS